MKERAIGALAVVVVNYRSAHLLERNLVPLTRECPDVTPIVVDNFSTLSERCRIMELAQAEEWQLLCLDENRGFGAGVNAGVAAARRSGADTFLFLNPDAHIDCRSLDVLRARFDEERFSILSPRIIRPDNSTWFAGCALTLDRGRIVSRPEQRHDERELAWLSGACLITGSEVWDVTGGFDEDYFLYWEDVDLSVRAAAEGAALAVVDAVRVVHDEGGTQNRSPTDDFSWDYYFFNIRNRLLFAAKNLDRADRRRWYRCSVRESYRILRRGGGRRKVLRPWIPLWCAVTALWAGWRMGRDVQPSGS